jgi:hypothetical protein
MVSTLFRKRNKRLGLLAAKVSKKKHRWAVLELANSGID